MPLPRWNHQNSLEALDDGFLLVVADNGRGLPDNFSIEESGGIGLELVKNLVGQLEGVLTTTQMTGQPLRLSSGSLSIRRGLRVECFEAILTPVQVA